MWNEDSLKRAVLKPWIPRLATLKTRLGNAIRAMPKEGILF
jgi:hypothetical protein